MSDGDTGFERKLETLVLLSVALAELNVGPLDDTLVDPGPLLVRPCWYSIVGLTASGTHLIPDHQEWAKAGMSWLGLVCDVVWIWCIMP